MTTFIIYWANNSWLVTKCDEEDMELILDDEKTQVNMYVCKTIKEVDLKYGTLLYLKNIPNKLDISKVNKVNAIIEGDNIKIHSE